MSHKEKWGEVAWVCTGSQFALSHYPSKMIFLLFWVCGLDALTRYCKLISFFLHLIIRNNCVYTEYRSNNFIIGLTNVSPLVSRPTLFNYTLCGQYPGAVPAGATIPMHCPPNLPQFRYVIVQFPMTESMNFCELAVIAPGTSLSTSNG